MDFTLSLIGLIGYCASKGAPSRHGEPLSIALRVVEGCVIHDNREKLAKMALGGGFTHILYIDDDMTFAPTILDALLGRRQQMVCVNYLVKTDDCRHFVAVNFDGTRIATEEASTNLEAVAFCGMGVALIDCEVLKGTPRPWFVPIYDAENDRTQEEDEAFFRRARAAGFVPWLDHDASKLVSHIGLKAWQWKDYCPD
jgi:hypothetical protein